MDGRIFNAPNTTEVVLQMRDEGRFTRTLSTEEYMTGFAKRMKLYNGKTVITDNHENFVQSLKEIGYFTEWLPPPPSVEITENSLD